jgi:exopolysaccharide biosynthesis operon protein EpsL
MSPKTLGRLCATAPVTASTILTLAFGIPDASALGSDTVFISGYGGITYDTNVFRLSSELSPSQVNAITGQRSNKDDTIYNIGVGVSADVPYSRQRFQANLNVNDYKYQNFSDLDYIGGSGRAAWLWQAGDDWSGDVIYTLSRSLQSFNYFASTQRNVIDRQSFSFDPRYRVAPNWELQAGVNYATVRNGLESFDVNDYNQFGWNVGTRYITPSGNSIGLRLESSDVRFPNLIFVQGSTFDDAYRDTRASTFFDWSFSGASKIDGSVGYKRRDHENLPQRDFSGITGSIGWTWTPTGRTGVRVTLAKDIGGLEDIAVTYVRTYTFTAKPTYQLTGKISLSGIAQYQDIRFLGNTGFGIFSTTADRHDKLGTLGAGAAYQATRTLLFGLNYTWSHRTSNVQFGDFNDNVVMATGQLTF